MNLFARQYKKTGYLERYKSYNIITGLYTYYIRIIAFNVRFWFVPNADCFCFFFKLNACKCYKKVLLMMLWQCREVGVWVCGGGGAHCHNSIPNLVTDAVTDAVTAQML